MLLNSRIRPQRRRNTAKFEAAGMPEHVGGHDGRTLRDLTIWEPYTRPQMFLNRPGASAA